MHNHAFSKIWIIVVIIIIVAGGILAWQYGWGPKEGVKSEVTDWKIYKNEKIGFQLKYPPSLKAISTDSPEWQREIEEAGLSQLTSDIFVDGDNEVQFEIKTFQPREESFSEDEYIDRFGNCDSRFGFNLITARTFIVNNIEVLERNGSISREGKSSVFVGCYYFKNYNKNLIVLSTYIFTDRFNNLANFEKLNSTLKTILSTLTLFSVDETAN